jgi:hypothetical protein
MEDFHGSAASVDARLYRKSQDAQGAGHEAEPRLGRLRPKELAAALMRVNGIADNAFHAL